MDIKQTVLTLSKKNYTIKSWKEKYPNYDVDINNLPIDESYRNFINDKQVRDALKDISEYLSYCMKTSNGEVNIFPYPDLLFLALLLTPLDNIKVVILGQDPYFKSEIISNVIVPQAMGLSFSVPNDVKIPPSLINIYKNMLKFKHLNEIPSSGNLINWANQGCLLLNTTLTVQEGCPNGHEKQWKIVTDKLIKYISDNTENVVFVLWGGPSYGKINLIDVKKHKVSISSHPSPLSYSNKLRNYESFEKTDHFGEINKYLTEKGKSKINW